MKLFIKQNWVFVITIVLCIILMLLFWIIICIYAKEQFWSASATLFVSLVSIVAGICISCLLYNYQQKIKNINKLNDLKVSLAAELSDIKRGLNRGGALTVNGKSFIITPLSAIITMECAKSSMFNSIDTENLIHITRKINLYNLMCENVLTVISLEKSELILWYHNNIDTTKNAIISDIDSLAGKMNLELSDSSNSD